MADTSNRMFPLIVIAGQQIVPFPIFGAMDEIRVEALDGTPGTVYAAILTI